MRIKDIICINMQNGGRYNFILEKEFRSYFKYSVKDIFFDISAYLF